MCTHFVTNCYEKYESGGIDNILRLGLGGLIPDCYATKRGYQLEFDKPLHRGWGQKGNCFRDVIF